MSLKIEVKQKDWDMNNNTEKERKVEAIQEVQFLNNNSRQRTKKMWEGNFQKQLLKKIMNFKEIFKKGKFLRTKGHHLPDWKGLPTKCPTQWLKNNTGQANYYKCSEH